MIDYCGKEYSCHLDLGLGLLKGKWKVLILCNLDQGPTRYNHLYKKIGRVSHSVFNDQLKELERDGMIKRIVYGEKIPVKVEFSLTDDGKMIIDALRVLENYAKENILTGF